jgi:sigma-B regulation protein RsbU (phosphoserine phosphatase)
VAFALGDVSGKGISAALVMANLHSIVRTQLSLLRPADGGGEIVFSTSELVSRTNRQLVACTAPEKFATFFFANYDDRSGALAYCNAGHLPPLLVRRGKARRLDVNGLIVGIMAEAPYNSSLLQLEPGDLLVAFTDGISEPENAYDQEFGEDRLIEIVIRESARPAHEIIEIVMEEVVAWTGAGELQDDMTMLVARRNA